MNTKPFHIETQNDQLTMLKTEPIGLNNLSTLKRSDAENTYKIWGRGSIH